MSENEREETLANDAVDETVAAEAAGQPTDADPQAEGATKLTELMASGAEAEAAKPRPDLDADALRAAQTAIAEGERALAEARAQLPDEPPPQPASRAKRRELVLRLLLAANVVAMIVVVMLPSSGGQGEPTAPPANVTASDPAAPQPAAPKLPPKFEQAMRASAAGDYASALTLLGEYLEQSPNMAPSRRITVYRQMAHYAEEIKQWSMARDYERKAEMMVESHRLPGDLIAMARAAHDSGDQEALRQIWARFLLQQRQIPSSLYQHVAEAYLQLGDSYRVQANAAAEQARLEELKKTEALLREQARNREQER